MNSRLVQQAVAWLRTLLTGVPLQRHYVIRVVVAVSENTDSVSVVREIMSDLRSSARLVESTRRGVVVQVIPDKTTQQLGD